MHVCLTGLRSTGKSTLARELASSLGWATYDTDDLAAAVLGRVGVSFFEQMRQHRYAEIYHAIEVGLHEVLPATPASVTAAGWGCLADAALRTLLLRQTLVIGLVPAVDPAQTVSILYPRERTRPHFAHLPDADLQELCRKDAADGIALLQEFCHKLVVGDDTLAVSRRRLLAIISDTSAHASSNTGTSESDVI